MYQKSYFMPNQMGIHNSQKEEGKIGLKDKFENPEVAPQ